MYKQVTELLKLFKRNHHVLNHCHDQISPWLAAMELPWSGDTLAKTIEMLEAFLLVSWNQVLVDLSVHGNMKELISKITIYLEGLLEALESDYLLDEKNGEIFFGIRSVCSVQIDLWGKLGAQDFDRHFEVIFEILMLIQDQKNECETTTEYPSHELHHPAFYEILSYFSREKPKGLERNPGHARDWRREAVSVLVTNASGDGVECYKDLGSEERLSDIIARLGARINPELFSLYKQFHDQDTNEPHGISFTHAVNVFFRGFFPEEVSFSMGSHRHTAITVLDQNRLSITQEYNVYDLMAQRVMFAVDEIPLCTLEVTTLMSVEEGVVKSSYTYHFRDNTINRLFMGMIKLYFPALQLEEDYAEMLSASGKSPLFESALFAKAIHAILTGDAEFIVSYVNAGLPIQDPGCLYPELRAGRKEELNLLHYACLNGEVNMLRLLMNLTNARRYFSARDRHGNIPFHYAAQRGHLCVFECAYEEFDVRDFSEKNQEGNTPLHLAGSNGYEAVVRYLLEKPELGFDVNERNLLGKTVAHLAAKNGHHDLFRVLNANLGISDHQGCLPLHEAILANNEETTACLLAIAGSNQCRLVITKNNEQESDAENEGETALGLAVKLGHPSLVVSIIKALNSDGSHESLHRNALGRTPLHTAVSMGREDLVSLLLNCTVIDLNVKDFQRDSALFIAARKGCGDIAMQLIDAGAELGGHNRAGECLAQLSAADLQVLRYVLDHQIAAIDSLFEGNLSLLHCAAKAGCCETVLYCLSQGANVSARDMQGCTPLDYAVKHRNALQLIQTFYEYGLAREHLHQAVPTGPLASLIFEGVFQGGHSLFYAIGRCLGKEESVFRAEVIEYLEVHIADLYHYRPNLATAKQVDPACLLVGSLEDVDYSFSEERVAGDGNCGFTAIGATRQQVVDCLRPLMSDAEFRLQLKEEMQQAVETEVFTFIAESESMLLRQRTEAQSVFDGLYRQLRSRHPGWQHTQGDRQDEQQGQFMLWLEREGFDEDAKNLRDLSLLLSQAEGELTLYFTRQDVCEAYIDALGNRLWLGYQSALLYAQAKRINLFIWRKNNDGDPGSLSLMHSHQIADATNTVYILHTDGFTHFNLLVIQDLTPENISVEADEYASFKKYIEDIRAYREWGDPIECELILKIIRQPIVVIRSNANPMIYGNLEEFPGNPIFLYRREGSRYDIFSLRDGFDARNVLGDIEAAIDQCQLVTYNPAPQFSVYLPILCVDNSGATLLHHLASSKGIVSVEAVTDCLLALGVNPFLRDAQGKTAFDIAMDTQNSNFLAHLLGMLKMSRDKKSGVVSFSLPCMLEPHLAVEVRHPLLTDYRPAVKPAFFCRPGGYAILTPIAGLKFSYQKGVGFKLDKQSDNKQKRSLVSVPTPEAALTALEELFFREKIFSSFAESEAMYLATAQKPMLRHEGWAQDSIQYQDDRDVVSLRFRLNVTAVEISDARVLVIDRRANDLDLPLCEVVLDYNLHSEEVPGVSIGRPVVTVTMLLHDYTQRQFFVRSIQARQAQDDYKVASRSQAGFIHVYLELTREFLLGRIEVLDNLTLQNILRIHESRALNLLIDDMLILDQAILMSLTGQRYDKNAYDLLTQLKAALSDYLSNKSEFLEIVAEIVNPGAPLTSNDQMLGRLNVFIREHLAFFRHYPLADFINVLMVAQHVEAPRSLFYYLLSSEQGLQTFELLKNATPGIGHYHPASEENRLETFLRLFFKKIALSLYAPDQEVPNEQQYSAVIELIHHASGILGRTVLHILTIYGDIHAVRQCLNIGRVACDARDGYGMTALHYAVLQGDYDIVEMLLAEGSDPTVQVEGRYSAFTIAVMNADVAMLRLLAAKGGVVGLAGLIMAEPVGLLLNAEHPLRLKFAGNHDLLLKCPAGMALSQLAMINRKRDALKCLIELGVDLVRLEESSVSVSGLPYCSSDSVLMIAASLGYLEEIKALLEDYLNAEQREQLIAYEYLAQNNEPCNALIVAIKRGQLEVLGYFDRVCQMNFNQPGVTGLSVLHYAINVGHQDIIIYVCEHYPDLMNHQDDRGNTALHYAVMHENAVAVQLLIEKGANARVRNTQDQDPLALAKLLPAHIAEGVTIRRILTLKMREVVQLEMQEQLQAAIETGDEEAVERLRHRGVNLNARLTDRGGDALHYAVSCQQNAVLRVLLGFNVIDLELADEGGFTAFLMAAYYHNLDALVQLFEAGASAFVFDHQGHNAMALVVLALENQISPQITSATAQAALSFLEQQGVALPENVGWHPGLFQAAPVAAVVNLDFDPDADVGAADDEVAENVAEHGAAAALYRRA